MPCTRERWRSTRSSASPSGQSSSDGAAPGGAGPPGLDRPRVQAAGLRSLAGRIYRTRVASKIAAVAMRLQRVRTFAFKALAQTGIAYHKSPLSQTLDGVAAAAPRAGDRFPWLHLRFRTDGPREDLFARLDDTRFNLLVFGQPAPSPERLGFGEVLEVHAVRPIRRTRRNLPACRFPGLRTTRCGLTATSASQARVSTTPRRSAGFRWLAFGVTHPGRVTSSTA
jgi:hypothetical protein